MFCKNCGKQIPDLSAKCPVCGASQTITEREYRTGARSPLGALWLQYRRQPVLRKWRIALELLGMLLGLGGVLFALLYPYDTLSVGHRAMLVLGGGTILISFGITLCITLTLCRKKGG